MAVAVACWLLLGIRLRFHNHATEQLAIRLAFHQQGADELGGGAARWGGKEGLGEVLGERGGYGSGFADGWRLLGENQRKLTMSTNIPCTQAAPTPEVTNFHTKRVTNGETDTTTQRP